MTRLTKPITRVVEVPGHGTMNVTLTADGITFRQFKKRSALTLPYGSAIVRAAYLKADEIRAAKKTKKRVRRGALGRT